MLTLCAKMNEEQERAFDMVKNGHNVYIGGQAGCGKSYIVRNVIKWAQDNNITVGLTCTTGVACCLYERALNPMTIHKWCGIGDGRFDKQKIESLLRDDDRYHAAKQRILGTNILVIDEISMLSLRMFNILEHCTRTIRDGVTRFGGMQIVVVGDFLQLQPVRNARYGDSGDLCFSSEHFPVHHVYLKVVMRQSDEELSSVIYALSHGHDISKDKQDYVKSLSRPLVRSKNETVCLFANNTLVDMYNRECLLQLHGEMYCFDAIDEGEVKHLHNLIVPSTLWLKKGASVMLLRNLTNELVNGLRGRVTAVRPGEVEVYFATIDKLSTLQRMNFSVYDPSSSTNLAVRSQIPLKLCYAMTIHKAQGMTLNRVEVDCAGMFQPGQLAVAMGRVKSADGLRVVNFKMNAIIPQPADVMAFLRKHTDPVKVDKSCCQHVVDEVLREELEDEDVICLEATRNSDITDGDIDVKLDDIDDDSMDEVLMKIDIQDIIFEKTQALPLPAEVDMKKELNSFKFVEPTRSNQIEHNEYIHFLLEKLAKLNDFCETQYSFMSKLYEQTITPTAKNTVPQSQLTLYYKRFQQHFTSDTYKTDCLNLFTPQHNTKTVFSLCFQIMAYLRKVLMKKRADVLPVGEVYQRLSLRSADKALTDTARGKIRYVAGYVVAKLHHKNNVLVQTCAYKTSRKDTENYEEGKRNLRILQSMKVNELTLTESDFLGTLQETSRKQNLNRGLTNVTDETFLFFEMLVSNILKLLSGVNLSIHGSEMYKYLKTSASNDSQLFDCFVRLSSEKDVHQNVSFDSVNDNQDSFEKVSVQMCMDDIVGNVLVVHELFDAFLDKAISLLMKQFSKDILISMNISKKMEHRKQVRVSTKPSKTKVSRESVSKPALSTPASSTSQSSLIPSTSTGPSKKNQPRKYVSKSAHSKPASTTQQSSPIPSTSTDPSTFPVPSTSQSSPSIPELRKSSRSRKRAKVLESAPEVEQEGTTCAKCSKLEVHGDDEQWICCDICDSWLHRKCAGLSHATKWEKKQKPGAHFECPQCE